MFFVTDVLTTAANQSGPLRALACVARGIQPGTRGLTYVLMCGSARAR